MILILAHVKHVQMIAICVHSALWVWSSATSHDVQKALKKNVDIEFPVVVKKK